MRGAPFAGPLCKSGAVVRGVSLPRKVGLRTIFQTPTRRPMTSTKSAAPAELITTAVAGSESSRSRIYDCRPDSSSHPMVAPWPLFSVTFWNNPQEQLAAKRKPLHRMTNVHFLIRLPVAQCRKYSKPFACLDSGAQPSVSSGRGSTRVPVTRFCRARSSRAARWSTRPRPSSRTPLVVGELVGDQQTNAHAQRDTGTGDKDQFGDCENSVFHNDAPEVLRGLKLRIEQLEKS